MKRPGEKRRKPRKKTPTLNPRQSKLLDGILKGKSVRAAAKAAGYGHSAEHAGELLDSAAMRRALRGRLPSVERIALRIGQGLDAKKTQFATFEGTITDSRDCVDYRERRKHAELACRLLGLLDVEPGDDVQRVSVVIHRNMPLEEIRNNFGKSDEAESES